MCCFRGTGAECDLPYWTAEAILEYAVKSEEVIDKTLFIVYILV